MRSVGWFCLVVGLMFAVILVGRLRAPHGSTKEMQRTMDAPVIYANPDYYDYLHYRRLGADDNAKLTAGAGQRIHFDAQGKYKLDLTNGTLELFELRETAPYGNEEVRRTLPARTNRFQRQIGLFAMRQETPFVPDSADEEPVIVFPERYVFESDPLEFAQEGAMSNLYYLTETRDLKASERIYYRSDLRERITLGEAKRRGLKLLTKAEQLAGLSTNQSPR